MGAHMPPEHFGRKLDIIAVLFESAGMSTLMPESAALTVLRALFDLAAVDMPATPDLLGRLLGLTPRRTSALLAQLRRAGLVQLEYPRLTMAGLVFATAIPETEPRSTPLASDLERELSSRAA
jgi:hypothetical protein